MNQLRFPRGTNGVLSYISKKKYEYEKHLIFLFKTEIYLIYITPRLFRGLTKYFHHSIDFISER